MKAKTIDIPTPRLLVLLVLVFISTCFGISTLQAEEITVLEKTELINLTDGSTIQMDTRTISEKLNDMSIEGQQIAEARAIRIAEEEARIAAQLLAEEEARAAAEAIRLAEEEARIAAILAEEARFSELGVCGSGSSYKKTYMDYRSISPYSKQMQIINSQTTVQDDGLLVTSDGFIGVALGSRYGNLGNKFRITTDTGQVFKVIKVDEKADAHTTNGCQDASGAMVEFVIDTEKVSSAYPQVTFSGSFHSIYKFSGNITRIESYY